MYLTVMVILSGVLHARYGMVAWYVIIALTSLYQSFGKELSNSATQHKAEEEAAKKEQLKAD